MTRHLELHCEIIRAFGVIGGQAVDLDGLQVTFVDTAGLRDAADPIEQEGDAARLEHLRRRIRPFLLRRTKAEVVAELPPKTEIVQTVTLGEKQAKVYEAIRLTMQERVRLCHVADIG